MSKISLADWSVEFAMDDECKKSRMKYAKNILASLISALNLGSENMHIEDMCNWQEEKLLMQSIT